MSEKMCLCKACNHEIAKSAKTCPHCGAKNKKKHPVLIACLIFFVLIGIFGSSEETNEPALVGDNGYTPVESISNNNSENSNKDVTFRVGQIAELNDVVVSMVNVSESAGSEYNTPTDGNVFVLCEFEIANNSNEEIAVSSMMSFEAYCDDYTCTFSLSALMEKGNKNQLDGTVAPGKKFNGVIGYELPSDWQVLEVHFTPDFWNDKDIIFIATK